MIVFSAFVPHTPLVTPVVGKEHTAKLKKTLAGFQTVKEELYLSHPDIIVLLSIQDNEQGEIFSLNLHEAYLADFKEFGDLATNTRYHPDFELIDHLQRELRKQNFPLALHSHESLSHGASVPLVMLTQELKNFTIVPINCSLQDAKIHVAFGRALKDVLSNSSKRIAVVASGDLSHALETGSPMGFHKEGAEFDKRIQQAIMDQATSKLLSFDTAFVEEAFECAYKPLLVLFGILERMNIRPEILSYEAPFGVGYLVATF